MSSSYTTTPSIPCRRLSITLWKIPVADEILSGSLGYRKSPFWVFITTKHLDSSSNRRCWYAWLKFNFVNTFPCSTSRRCLPPLKSSIWHWIHGKSKVSANVNTACHVWVQGWLGQPIWKPPQALWFLPLVLGMVFGSTWILALNRSIVPNLSWKTAGCLSSTACSESVWTGWICFQSNLMRLSHFCPAGLDQILPLPSRAHLQLPGHCIQVYITTTYGWGRT